MLIKEYALKLYWKSPNLVKRVLLSLFSFVMRLINPLISYKIKKGKFSSKKIRFISDLNDLIEFVSKFQYLGFSIKTAQVKDEIIEFLKILKSYRPNVILEIGTAGGGTLFLFTRIAQSNATIISVDLPKGFYGGGYKKWKSPIYRSFAIQKQKVKLIRANSHSQETLNAVKHLMNQKKIDFLFIDGDHTYAGVKKDFEMYSNLVKKGGIIAFHDIVEHSSEGGCQVNKFWDEIKNNYQTLEIIQDKSQKWAGIGIIFY